MAENRRKIGIITQHSSRATPTEIDWEKCFICQKAISKESLQSNVRGKFEIVVCFKKMNIVHAFFVVKGDTFKSRYAMT